MVTVRGSGKSVEARLRSGALIYSCGGRLRPWGHARRAAGRDVRRAGGGAAAAGICREGCGRTQVLLPSFLLSRAAVLPLADPQARPVATAGWPPADALAALEAVTAGLRRRFAGLDRLAVHEVAARAWRSRLTRSA